MVPGVSRDAPFAPILEQQEAAHVMVHLGAVLHYLGRAQGYCDIAEDENLHPNRPLLEGTQRALSQTIHARDKGIKRLLAHRPNRWKERGIR